MIEYNCEQRSPEWIDRHIGIVTASNFTDIITPVKGELSASRRPCMAELLGERFALRPLDEVGSTRWMQRGTEQEPEAIDWVQNRFQVDVRTIGIGMLDDRSAAASPDGIIDDDAGLEVKVVSAKNHWLARLDGIPVKWKPQVQGNMWIWNRARWLVVLYNSFFPPVFEWWERDEPYIERMAGGIAELNAELDALCPQHFVPPDWRERIEARIVERAACDVEAEKYYPTQERAPGDMEDTRRAFLAGGRVKH